METTLKPDPRVLLTIAGQAAHRAQTWSMASAAKLRELAHRFYGLQVSARTWHRHYHAWRKLGYIEVRHRHKRTRAGNLECHSNVTILTNSARTFLARLANAVTLARNHTKNTANPGMPNMALSGTSTPTFVVLNGSNTCITKQHSTDALARALEKLRKTVTRRQ